MVGDDQETSSNKGRATAAVALKKSYHAGPALVPLADYNQSVSSSSSPPGPQRGHPQSAVLSATWCCSTTYHELGAALMTAGAIALRFHRQRKPASPNVFRIFKDDLIYVPHAVEVSGQIITVYDPSSTAPTILKKMRWISLGVMLPPCR